MKKIVPLLALTALLIVGLTATALAQRGPGKRAPRQDRLYDVATVETVKGEVISVETSPAPQGRGYGIHLRLKTDAETIAVHLGPKWYVEEQALQVKAGDQIEVKGSRVTYEDQPVIVADQVTRGAETMDLRNDDGTPKWAGEGQGKNRPGRDDRPRRRAN